MFTLHATDQQLCLESGLTFHCTGCDVSLVSCVKFQFKIRKEALVGLGQIYRRCYESDNLDDVKSVSWIRNKVLHAYYHSAIDDKYLSTLTCITSYFHYSCSLYVVLWVSLFAVWVCLEEDCASMPCGSLMYNSAATITLLP